MSAISHSKGFRSEWSPEVSPPQGRLFAEQIKMINVTTQRVAALCSFLKPELLPTLTTTNGFLFIKLPLEWIGLLEPPPLTWFRPMGKDYVSSFDWPLARSCHARTNRLEIFLCWISCLSVACAFCIWEPWRFQDDETIKKSAENFKILFYWVNLNIHKHKCVYSKNDVVHKHKKNKQTENKLTKQAFFLIIYTKKILHSPYETITKNNKNKSVKLNNLGIFFFFLHSRKASVEGRLWPDNNFWCLWGTKKKKKKTQTIKERQQRDAQEKKNSSAWKQQSKILFYIDF